MCVFLSTAHLSTYLAIVSAERSSGFLTLVSPAGDKRKTLFTVSDSKADQPHDVIREQEHMMWDELVNGGVILGLHFIILVLWP